MGLVGFTAAGSGKKSSAQGGSVQKGKDRAFHAGFVEFGTKNRKTFGSIASSFNRLGPFRIARIAKRGKFAGVVRVNTSPKYPKAFFKKAPRGQTVDLREMPLGGSSGKAPVKDAYRRSLPTMRTELSKQMTLALQNALKDLAYKFPAKRDSDIGPVPF